MENTRPMESAQMQPWNQKAYIKQFALVLGLTTRDIRIALQQKAAMTREAAAAYEYVLWTRGESFRRQG